MNVSVEEGLEPSTARKLVGPPTIVLVLLTMVGPFSFNIFVPSTPSIAAELETSLVYAQWTLTAYLIGMAAGQLIYGPMSDRWGRRPVMFTSLVGFFLASILVAISPTIESLVLARGIQALCGCSTMVLTRAIVMDVYGQDRAASALAYITMAMAAAPAMAPAIGGLMDQYFSWRMSGWLLVGWGMAALLLARMFLVETNMNRIPRIHVIALLEIYRHLLKSRVFLTYTFFNVFMVGSFFTFVGGTPYVVVNIMGGTPTDYGFYFVLVSIGFMCGSFVAGRFSNRLGRDRMILLGSLVALAGSLATFVTTMVMPLTLPGLFIPIMVVSAGNGIAQPNALAAAVGANPELAGSASGLLGFIQTGIAGIFMLLIAALLDGAETHLALLLMILATIVAAFLCFLYSLRLPSRQA